MKKSFISFVSFGFRVQTISLDTNSIIFRFAIRLGPQVWSVLQNGQTLRILRCESQPGVVGRDPGLLPSDGHSLSDPGLCGLAAGGVAVLGGLAVQPDVVLLLGDQDVLDGGPLGLTADDLE